MFQIYDGREYFFQWDKDRKLIVMDGSIKEVHFCNRTEECSLRREVYKDGELHLVDVPNILLQDNYKINVYGYDGNYTKQSTTFTVKARSKPDDYIYTEEEVKEWEELEARITALEGAEVDLTGYATEEFVNANLTIKPLPIKEKQLTNTSVRYYVDLEELDSITPYGLGEIPEEEKGLSGLICYCIYAEDGTRKLIAMQQKNTVVSFFRNGDFEYSLLPIMPVGINAEYVINVTDKTTANNITFTTTRNRDFLGINNNQAFTPENDYQPATKKYVDDNKPDWNAQENENGYILNRPFGYTEECLLPPTNVEFVEDGGMFGSIIYEDISFIEGATYVVDWDGVEYSCVATDAAIGNTAIFSGEDNGIPFAIGSSVMDGENIIAIVAFDNSNPKTVSIIERSYKTIDKNYLPKIENSDLPAVPTFDLTTFFDEALTETANISIDIGEELVNSINKAASKGVVRFVVPFAFPNFAGVEKLYVLGHATADYYRFSTIVAERLISIDTYTNSIQFKVRAI